ncbi:hypothetical protein Tco_0052011 [Tanacetum coccineum]
MECRVRRLRRDTFISYAVTSSIPINKGPIQAIRTSLPPQPIGEATKASNLRRIPPGVQERSHLTYFLYLIVQIRILLAQFRRRLTTNGVVMSLIATNVVVFLLSSVIDRMFMLQNFTSEEDNGPMRRTVSSDEDQDWPIFGSNIKYHGVVSRER